MQRAPETGATKFTIRQNDSLLDGLEDISCLLTKDIGSQALCPSCKIPGAIGYAVAGRNYANLLPLSFGHVLLIEFALRTPFSLFTVRYGINCAYHMQKLQMGLARSGYLILIRLARDL